MSVDVLIVGQGLAGTTLAWKLIERGLSFHIVDFPGHPCASQIAAGLITPITGQRLVKSWRFDDFWAAAAPFYRRVEAAIAATIFDERPSLRIFESADEARRFQSRSSELAMNSRCIAPASIHGIPCEHGAFEMFPAGRLNLPEYLARSRQHFHEIGCLISGQPFPDQIPVEDNSSCMQLPPYNVAAQRIVFCGGMLDRHRPLFSPLRFNPSRGEILEVNLPSTLLRQVVHRGVWLAPKSLPPDGSTQYRLGSTYDTARLGDFVTVEGASYLMERLRLIVENVAFNPESIIIRQMAAVRPNTLDTFPFVGWHPDHPRVGMLNGLGSKGSLMAPLLARWLLDAIDTPEAIPHEASLQREWRNHP